MSDMKIKTAVGKPDLALIPLTALYGVARVFEYGAKKYAKDNWKLASDADAPMRYLSAALRHEACIQQDPTALDTESGLLHLDHAICSLLMLRGLLTLHHGLAADPGEGKEPPTFKVTRQRVHGADPAYMWDTDYCADCLRDNCVCERRGPRVHEQVPILTKPGACTRCGYLACVCYGPSLDTNP